MEGWAEFLREMKNYYNVSALKGAWGLDDVPAAPPTTVLLLYHEHATSGAVLASRVEAGSGCPDTYRLVGSTHFTGGP